MLPFTCFFVDDSKSNSSSRLPLSTTTLVSSGWAASISMRLDIRAELRGARLRPPDGRLAARSCFEKVRKCLSSLASWKIHGAGKARPVRLIQFAPPTAAGPDGGKDLPAIQAASQRHRTGVPAGGFRYENVMAASPD